MRVALERLFALVLLGSWLGGSTAIAASLADRNAANQYRALGLSYREEGRFAEAIAALQQSVDLDPDHLAGRVNLGWTLHLDRQDQAAAQVLQQTASLDPFHVPTFNALGIVYLMNGDLAAAALTHAWAALLKPDNEIAHYNLSLAWQQLQQYDWAIAAAQKASVLEAENPHPWVALAIAYWGKQDIEKAQQAYQQAIDLDGRYSDSGFLDYLNEAGFSSDQIATSKQVLDLLR